MRRLGLLFVIAFVASVAAPSVLAARPAPVGWTTLTQSKCTLTATGTWPANVTVTDVYAAWYEDGNDLAHFVLSQDTDPTHFGHGTISGTTAAFTLALVKSRARHDWYVRLDFYNTGAYVDQYWAGPNAYSCSF